jgi:hypothetical protein
VTLCSYYSLLVSFKIKIAVYEIVPGTIITGKGKTTLGPTHVTIIVFVIVSIAVAICEALSELDKVKFKNIVVNVGARLPAIGGVVTNAEVSTDIPAAGIAILKDAPVQYEMKPVSILTAAVEVVSCSVNPTKAFLIAFVRIDATESPDISTAPKI